MKKSALDFKKAAAKLSQAIGIQATAQELRIPATVLVELHKNHSGIGMIFQGALKICVKKESERRLKVTFSKTLS